MSYRCGRCYVDVMWNDSTLATYNQSNQQVSSRARDSSGYCDTGYSQAIHHHTYHKVTGLHDYSLKNNKFS
jgi:hypothetical protein